MASLPAPLSARLSARAEAVRRWFFPETVELPEGLDRVLGQLFPRLDRRRVRFRRGLPHVLNWIPNQAITLPALAPRAGSVYLHRDCCEIDSFDRAGLYVHESYHLLQLQESGWGLGLARPFIVLYLACAARNGFRYAGHPMESDAYRVAGTRESLFEAAVDPVLLPLGFLRGEPGCDGPDSDTLAGCCAPAVTEASGVAFWRKLAESTPGYAGLTGMVRRLMAPRGSGVAAQLARAALTLAAAAPLALTGLLVAAWLLVWSLAAAILAAGEVLVLGAGALATGALALLAALSSLFERRA
jgi:hypothetical protein